MLKSPSVFLALFAAFAVASVSLAVEVDEHYHRNLAVVEVVPPLRQPQQLRGLKGGKGGGSFGGGGGSYGGGSRYGSSGRGFSRTPTTTVYTTPGRFGYRPWLYSSRAREEDYNCTDTYNVTTNVTTTECVYTGDNSSGAFIAIPIVFSLLFAGLIGYKCWWQKRNRSGDYPTKAGASYPKQESAILNEQYDKARVEIASAYDKGTKRRRGKSRFLRVELATYDSACDLYFNYRNRSRKPNHKSQGES